MPIERLSNLKNQYNKTGNREFLKEASALCVDNGLSLPNWVTHSKLNKKRGRKAFNEQPLDKVMPRIDAALEYHLTKFKHGANAKKINGKWESELITVREKLLKQLNKSDKRLQEHCKHFKATITHEPDHSYGVLEKADTQTQTPMDLYTCTFDNEDVWRSFKMKRSYHFLIKIKETKPKK